MSSAAVCFHARKLGIPPSTLLSTGLKTDHCEECGLTEWLGEPLNMALHHVNADQTDNRFANLRLLCPNCHSQTPNFARKPQAA